ncbi:hypothetical protein D1841_08765 [Neglecta sp. X4]|uniref:hypothetical protein n=1 Tax=unclassified Neglectibacter TaxID=2632164 RepID=UPI00136E4595|nr:MULTISPECIES: hypothetical protein [unclassified Neglectibacter]NBI17666.1 hypothetical protein [Neglectibacter sp. 59]NBJ73390.1 hypothetical protein [Neglectibacter sp. X4]NCE81722.1 hypothetical protein [Neglectibacter sp. X58]
MKNKLFRCRNDLDERQLLQRGDVFQHGIILFFVLLLANAFLKEGGIVWAEGMWENLLIIWSVITLCMCEYAVKEIYPMGGGMTVIYVLEGACGAFLFIMGVVEVSMGWEPLALEGGALSRTGAQIVQGFLMVLLLLVFCGKKVYNHRKETQDNET